MAHFTCAMNISLDGYVDHDRFAPGPALFQHWTEAVRATQVSICGRRIYELMRYWDTDQPDWTDALSAFALAWRAQRKYVVSTTLTEVGPNATLIAADPVAQIRALKETLAGEVAIAGTQLAGALGAAGLIDEYRLYYHPVVLGHGKPFFATPLPRLRLTGQEIMEPDVIRLTYVPA